MALLMGRNLETGPEVESVGPSRATKGISECGRGQDVDPVCGRLTIEAVRGNMMQKIKKCKAYWPNNTSLGFINSFATH